jgi:hypothetical protein
MSGIAQTAIKICNDPEIQKHTNPKYKQIHNEYNTLPNHTRQVCEARLAGPILCVLY